MNPVEPEILPESVTIIPAGWTQASMLAAMIRQSYADVARRFGITPRNGPTHPSACTVDWVQSDFREGVRYYLAACGNMHIGCAATKTATPDCHYLMRLAVLPLFRRKGIGQRLVVHICRQARKAGAEKVSAGIIAEQDDLAAWYRRQGFKSAGQQRFDHLPFGVRFMHRELG